MSRPWTKYVMIGLIVVVAAVLLVGKSFTSCNASDQPESDPNLVPKPTPLISFQIGEKFPHDTAAYTEGLQVYDGKFYEGTGMENESTLQIANMKTGIVENRKKYTDPKIFGEGIQVFKNKIYQLTWQNHLAFVYDIRNIQNPIDTFNWPYEGWGMTNNGTDLIISDGSPNLYFVDPSNFKILKTLPVYESGHSVYQINELEYIDGFIYANVWQTNDIVKIDPNTGKVVGKISLGDLPKQYFADKITERTDVLNGIAYDSTTKKIYITGKRWPYVFELILK